MNSVNIDGLDQDWAELRTSKGISLESISEQTHIPVHKLSAIENKEFSVLGDATFAIGYIRSYAKILGEDPQAFIQVFKDATHQDSESTNDSLLHVRSERDDITRHFSLRNVSIAVIALWVLLMLIWGDSDENKLESEASALAVDGISEQMVEDAPTHESVETVKPLESNADVQPSAAIPSQVDTLSDVNNSSALVSESVSGTDVSSGAEIVDSPQEPAQLTTSDDILVFGFAEDCWVQVTDASGRVLIAQLKRKGDNLQIFGQAPFEIMLGNARSVTLTINGRSVSTQPPLGKKTLRFKVAS